MSTFKNPAWLPFSVSEAASAGDARSEALDSGEAWAHLLAALQRVGDVVLSDSVPHEPVDRASGIRHLLVLLGVGIDELLRRGLDRVPAMKPSGMDAAYKWGMECPDCIYSGSALKGGETYRLRGTRGSARYVGLQVMSGMASSFNALLDDFELGPDGEFEAILSADAHPGNWIPLDEHATMLVVRHFFYDWEHEVPARLSIEPASGPAPGAGPASVDPKAAVARQVIALGDFIEDNLRFFLDFANPEAPNAFLPPLDGTAMGAAAENRPVIGSWKLAADEALIIEVTPPEGLYWGFSLGNTWWETIDYGNRQSSLNGHQAVPDDDGKVRVVVAHQDPGVANWLDTAGHSEGPIILRCVRTDTAPDADHPRCALRPVGRRASRTMPPLTPTGASRGDRRPPPGREQAVRAVSLDVEQIEESARAQTGLDDTGGDDYREGLERLVESMNNEGDLTELGEAMQHARLVALLAARLQIEDTYRAHPEIDGEEIAGPVFVIGLPRTGTTALSQLVAADPQFRSLRVWESGSPVPPPETATEHSDPRIAATEGNLALMNEAFPLMRTMHHVEATTATECQDLMGMSFRTAHFDGFARVPSYMAWVIDTDMRGTYQYHRRALRLLQWHCPPTLWHLKTPVHMFALDALIEAYPNARFLWSHRDPAKVLGSVCSLIHYTRSWSSDRDDAVELGAEELERWWMAVRRAMEFRRHVGDARFADIAFDDLQSDPVAALAEGLTTIGLGFDERSWVSVERWAASHPPGAQGTHRYDLGDFGLTPGQVRECFSPYYAAFDIET